MTLNLSMNKQAEIMPKITVFGIGGAGGNAVNNMIKKELQGVEFIAANTDAQALRESSAMVRIQLGQTVTEGLGAGAKPEVGAAAAEETIEEIVDQLVGSHLCFITAGMGGGTGTGAAPIIAHAARELGILTVGVVTKPFQFEGGVRMRIADEGVGMLQPMVDTLIVIPNQNLFRLANEKTTFNEAFAMADDVLYQGVKGVTDLMVRPGLINLDFADVRTVMDEMGKAMMGSGEASGPDRAKEATEKAIANPLLDEISLQGARGVLINVTGGHDLTLFELDEAATTIKSIVDRNATIITGSTLDEAMEGTMRVSIVATGIGGDAIEETKGPQATDVISQDTFADSGDEPTAQEQELSAVEPMSEFDAPIQETEPQLNGQQMDLEPPIGSDSSAPEDLDHQEGLNGFATAPFQPDDIPPSPEQETSAEDTSASCAKIPDSGIRKPGVPSPETMARLRAAVAKVPEPASDDTEEVIEEAPHTPRFRPGGLINRMTKQNDAAAANGQDPMDPMICNSAQSSSEPDARTAEHERVGIPAFLRRQAN